MPLRHRKTESMLPRLSIFSTHLGLSLRRNSVRVRKCTSLPIRTLTLHVAAVGFEKSFAPKYKRELDICVAALKEMKKRGIKILPGGDYG